MKIQFIVILVIFSCITLFSKNANAEYGAMASDVIFFRGGLTLLSNSTIENQNNEDLNYTIESRGANAQVEYNINFETFFVGIGLEYEYHLSKVSPETGSESEYFFNQYLNPSLNLKLTSDSGMYYGAELTGKYLFKTQTVDNTDFEKKTDLWTKAILGYNMPINDTLIFDIGIKLGFNITNQQFKFRKNFETTDDYEGKSAFDMILYAGIGLRLTSFN